MLMAWMSVILFIILYAHLSLGRAAATFLACCAGTIAGPHRSTENQERRQRQHPCPPPPPLRSHKSGSLLLRLHRAAAWSQPPVAMCLDTATRWARAASPLQRIVHQRRLRTWRPGSNSDGADEEASHGISEVVAMLRAALRTHGIMMINKGLVSAANITEAALACIKPSTPCVLIVVELTMLFLQDAVNKPLPI